MGSDRRDGEMRIDARGPGIGCDPVLLVSILFLALVIVLVAMGVAHAGTGGTEFDEVNNRITEMIEGGGGKLAAGLGLVAALAASVIRFNIWAVIGAFGVGAMAGYGMPIVTSSISATI